MNVFEALKRENAATLKLLRKLEDTTAHDVAERTRLLEQLRIQVAATNGAEEGTLYAVLVNDPHTYAASLASQEENREIEQLLEELRRTPLDARHFKPNVEVLVELVRKHVAREEHELFLRAERLLDPEHAEALGDRLPGEKQRLERQLAG